MGVRAIALLGALSACQPSVAETLNLGGLELCLAADRRPTACLDLPPEFGLEPDPRPRAEGAVRGSEIRRRYVQGPGWLETALPLAGVNVLDWSTTRRRLREESGWEAGPFSRLVGNDWRLALAPLIEIGVVQWLRAKGHNEWAWGVFAGFLAGHLFLAGCNRTGSCW